ncbi:MAG: corrinoid protein [Bacteroidales bacterium]|nr:corrinoid protein [Bacteroidales bacterium]
MDEIIQKISSCIEYGKINRASPYPPGMKDQDGAYELTRQALDRGISPSEILESGMIPAMEIVGNKFSRNEIFVPQMLMSAKAMNAAMEHIKPFFISGEAKRKGVFVIGTVAGDLHDIGKNLVAMMIEGGGWEVIDLGVDVKPDKFKDSIRQYPGCFVGLSALLTTTMENMKITVKELKEQYPHIKVLIGGAPVTDDFRQKIGADFYSPDPQGAVKYLNTNRVLQ